MGRKAKKRKGFKREKIDAFKTFVNAWSYQYVTKVLNEHPHHKEQLVWPTIVNEALALELFLKCIHEVRKRIIWGHTPKAMFDRLSKADRTSIEIRYNAHILGHPSAYPAAKAGVQMNIDTVLLRADKLFTGGRYWHEGLDLKRDDRGYATNAGVGTISDSIRDLLFSINPDWLDRLAKYTWVGPGMTRIATSQHR